MPSFSSNYLLNFSSETLNCCTQLLLWYFGPSFNQRDFQRLHSCVWWVTGLSSKHGPDTEVHWVEIRRWRRPQLLAPKLQEIVFASSLGFIGGVSRNTVLLESKIINFEVLFHIIQGRGQNVINIHICVDLGTLLFVLTCIIYSLGCTCCSSSEHDQTSKSCASWGWLCK